VERALNEELRGLTGDNDVPSGARALLRAAAHLVDRADEAGDIEAGAKIIPRYLELRVAYGLAGSVAGPLDPFAAFVAGMSAPTLRNEADSD
jgi:hypothetical protein